MNISGITNISPDLDEIDYSFLDIEDNLQPIKFISELSNIKKQADSNFYKPSPSNSFNLESILDALNSTRDPLYYDPEYLDKYILDKHIDKIKTWMSVNCHHTFPKTKKGWLNVFYMHFLKMHIHMDLDKILELERSKEEIKSPKINQLVNKIRKLIKRRTFASTFDPRTRNRLLAHCNLTSYATPNQLYNEMVKLGIILEEDCKLNFSPIVKEEENKRINEDSLDNLTNKFKRIKVV
jgi:hypothetical protein